MKDEEVREGMNGVSELEKDDIEDVDEDGGKLLSRRREFIKIGFLVNGFV